MTESESAMATMLGIRDIDVAMAGGRANMTPLR
jgi:hypothetical protein